MSRGLRVGGGHFDVMDHRSFTGDIDGDSQQAIGLAREIVRYLPRKIIQPSLMLDRFAINYELWQYLSLTVPNGSGHDQLGEMMSVFWQPSPNSTQPSRAYGTTKNIQSIDFWASGG